MLLCESSMVLLVSSWSHRPMSCSGRTALVSETSNLKFMWSAVSSKMSALATTSDLSVASMAFISRLRISCSILLSSPHTICGTALLACTFTRTFFDSTLGPTNASAARSVACRSNRRTSDWPLISLSSSSPATIERAFFISPARAFTAWAFSSVLEPPMEVIMSVSAASAPSFTLWTIPRAPMTVPPTSRRAAIWIPTSKRALSVLRMMGQAMSVEISCCPLTRERMSRTMGLNSGAIILSTNTVPNASGREMPVSLLAMGFHSVTRPWVSIPNTGSGMVSIS
mmetsp:Transcript_12958/g.21207  ORF Transcript_12958/g.21207 Transcript_12958/m.21207 type:complete len:284 (+) Transcript_12958:2424-3275(+)